MSLDRITFNDRIMGGRACIRGMRIPVSVVLKMMAGGMSVDEILADYPDLERKDIEQCMQYARCRRPACNPAREVFKPEAWQQLAGGKR